MIRILSFCLLIVACNICFGQSVPIEDFSVNHTGQVQLEIQAEADKYYLLRVQHPPNLEYESYTSITKGVDGPLIITEPGGAFEKQNYSITEHSIDNPMDIDGDGIDDITELENMPTQAPLNFARTISIVDGTTSLDSQETFDQLSVVEEDIPWSPFLNNQQFAKFIIVNQSSDEPEVYFINTLTHDVHASFISELNFEEFDIVRGEIVYNPNDFTDNGVVGTYRFNYSLGFTNSFEMTQRTFELLLANMPYLRNNMKHFVGSESEESFNTENKEGFEGSRIEVILESELFQDVDFIPFNRTEGFGFFKKINIDENPGSRDIVLYDALPNTLPRVGGIITSVVQTPLSHVNLRAIQDDVPNAFIRDPLAIDSIANLLNKFIYFKVDNDGYQIREASIEEVNAWFDDIRPSKEQIPDRDLSIDRILPLDSIYFNMSTSFGAKCANVATMRRFGFPEGTIPDGYGIPFYFYDEFMKFNNFYSDIEEIITDPDFINDLDTRIDMLSEFRKKVRKAPMPQWMLDELEEMHNSFPEGTAVRVRSSTNNEDLPGFSGAGLYTSKTQHLDEGHISKSVKQVYASIWNFRAFDERDFYRVDHFIAAMGLLCHPNFEDEKSNGVGVSIDPVFQTPNTYYLNTQVGESLITNPDVDALPEEMLLFQDASIGFSVLRESNLAPPGELVMDEEFINQMRDYMGVIHDEFGSLYGAEDVEGFGMDIEYKVTSQNQLIIKQARPWVSFWSEVNDDFDLGINSILNPSSSSSLGDNEFVTVRVENTGLNDMVDFNLSLIVDNQQVESIVIADTLSPFNNADYQFTIPVDFSEKGDYNISAIVSSLSDSYNKNDTLNVVVSSLHQLDARLSIEKAIAKCGNEIEITTLISNLGDSNIDNVEIGIIVNGLEVEPLLINTSIFSESEKSVKFIVTENLQATDNIIELELINLNGQSDAVLENNDASISADLGSDFDLITLVINSDDFPQDISWQINDETANELVAQGELNESNFTFSEEICVNYNNCFSVKLLDSFGDGITGGSFMVLDTIGNTLLTNNDSFNSQIVDYICLSEQACAFVANITTIDTDDVTSSNGSISIVTTGGLEPFQYSIDNGQTFLTTNTFSELTQGEYMVVVLDASGTCSYRETVSIEVDVVSSVSEIYQDDIKVYPNPTIGELNIEFSNNPIFLEGLKIEIFDSLGRLIQSSSLTNGVQESNILMSIDDFNSGAYYLKCSNENFEKHFKLIKM